MQAPNRGPKERSGEVFLLDILSHRMSVIGILRQLRLRSVVKEGVPLSRQTGTLNVKQPVASQTVAEQYILTVFSISS